MQWLHCLRRFLPPFEGAFLLDVSPPDENPGPIKSIQAQQNTFDLASPTRSVAAEALRVWKGEEPVSHPVVTLAVVPDCRNTIDIAHKGIKDCRLGVCAIFANLVRSLNGIRDWMHKLSVVKPKLVSPQIRSCGEQVGMHAPLKAL